MDRCDIAAAALAAADLHLNGLPPGAIAARRAANRQIIVIGDTQHDIRCGRSIGARCVAVPTGMASKEVLRDAQPDVLVETLEDISPILALFTDEQSGALAG
jgi:phosphoglycolate phosphatase-like HAD superfamily hydrolase